MIRLPFVRRSALDEALFRVESLLCELRAQRDLIADLRQRVRLLETLRAARDELARTP